MGAVATDRLDCLLVVPDEELHGRLKEVFDAWHLRYERLDQDAAMTSAMRGLCRIVVVERFAGLRLYLERLRATGAVPIVLGLDGPDVTPEIECVVRPSELVASVFRAQGRLQGLDGGGATRISNLAKVIAEQFALPELVSVAMAKTRDLCEAEGASLLLIEPSTGGLYFDAVDGGAGGKIERVQLPRGKGIAGRVASEAKPRLVEDVQRCEDFDPSADRQTGFVTGSVVAAPLVLSGDVLGVLMAVRSAASPPFSPIHLERLVQLTPHVAIAVHNAQITTALRLSQHQVLEANVDLEKRIVERTQQITRAKQEWERTFDAIDTPIALLDGYRIRRINLAYARKVGREVREIPGQTCHKLFAQRDTPCPGCPLADGRGKALASEIETPDIQTGRPAYYRFHGYWLNDDPAAPTVVVTYHDITESHVLADKLRESERLAAVGQLASGAAHEINNPLGFVTSNLRSLRGLLDELRGPLSTYADLVQMVQARRFDEARGVLAAGEAPDTQSLDDGLEMIDESLDGARRVGDIVKGLRELSRLEIGKREPADVNSSVTRVVRSELGDGANVELQLEAQRLADIPPLQLDQALTHILRNARQATLKKEKIVVRTYHVDGLIFVQVRDEGVGIPKENLRRVFEPFFTTRGVGKGIGLGLTAAYGIVKRVGGDIEAKSDGPGSGATFTVRLLPAERQALTDAA